MWFAAILFLGLLRHDVTIVWCDFIFFLDAIQPFGVIAACVTIRRDGVIMSAATITHNGFFITHATIQRSGVVARCVTIL